MCKVVAPPRTRLVHLIFLHYSSLSQQFRLTYFSHLMTLLDFYQTRGLHTPVFWRGDRKFTVVAATASVSCGSRNSGYEPKKYYYISSILRECTWFPQYSFTGTSSDVYGTSSTYGKRNSRPENDSHGLQMQRPSAARNARPCCFTNSPNSHIKMSVNQTLSAPRAVKV